MGSNLFNQIISFENLLLACNKACKGKKDRLDVMKLNFSMEREIIELQELLDGGSYIPDKYKIFKILEPKERVIAAAGLRDRVVHHAIVNIVDPRIERRLISDTYACRIGKGTHRAIKRAQYFSRKFKYFLKCDIRKYFDNIDHGILMQILNRLFADDKKLLSLLGIIVSHQLPNRPNGVGLPIGNLTSQHFANLYLDKLDHFVKDQSGFKGYVRYMDDFLIFHDDKKVLAAFLKQIVCFLDERLKLELKDKVTQLSPVICGIPFLGMRIFPSLIRVKRENLVRLRRNIKRREREFSESKIDDEKLAQSVGSMISHIRVAETANLRREIFG